jgi:4-alpha-glucanotransferase
MALLRAMGIAVSDDQSAVAAFTRLQNDEASLALRPVYVLHQGKPMRISIALPPATRQFRWSITCETGPDSHGTADFSSLPTVASRDPELPTQTQSVAAIDSSTERRYWRPPEHLACGYHQLTVEGEHRSTLIVAPHQAWVPKAVEEGGRLWGLSAQVYLLRSRDNWGIGDYSDLKKLIELLAPLGGDIVGVNPLHAMFPDDPEQASPYSPASRLLLNVLNIDVAHVAHETPEFDLAAVLREASVARQLRQCRESRLVDYSSVSTLKLRVLQSLFDAWRARPRSERWQAFERFRHDAGEGFARDVTFLALREHFSQSARADWHSWPASHQDPESIEVKKFALEHEDRITFHACLQYWADSQLASVAGAAGKMKVGLYRDLAVGANDSGAETWGNQNAVMGQVHVGAPPDIYNPAGQNWGLPPFNPRALEAEAYRSFIDLIRANMRYSGALRIDHVMGLQHLYCVPAGCSPAEGAYVRYPLDDLVGILKLESVRHQCLIVGEDLGTVPEGFRERMAEARILSYRVLFFEKDHDALKSPAEYPRMSVAVEGSHDLPTLRAWWSGSDLKLKEQLHLFPRAADAEQARTERKQDREAFIAALGEQGIASQPLNADQLFEAAYGFLARTASALALVQLDDITDEEDPVNVPNTSVEHANWRRKTSMDLDAIKSSPRLQQVAELFNAARSPQRCGSTEGTES